MSEKLPDNELNERRDTNRDPKPSPEPYTKKNSANEEKVIRDHLGRRLCGAKCRGKDKRCRQPALQNGRCRLHGGLTPGGMASPHYKHGMRSKYLEMLPAPPVPKRDRELASQDLELILAMDHLKSIRDRVNELVFTKKVAESKQWRECVHAVCEATNCTGAAELALLKLPSTVPDASIRKLMAGLLETTDSILAHELNTHDASETLMVFCDQVRHCMR